MPAHRQHPAALIAGIICAVLSALVLLAAIVRRAGAARGRRRA